MRIEPAPSPARGDRHQPGGDRRGAAAAGAAGAALRVPGVAGDTPGRGLGEAGDRQLGQVGLADHDRPGRAQAADHLGVAAAGLGECVGAVRGVLPGEV